MSPPRPRSREDRSSDRPVTNQDPLIINRKPLESLSELVPAEPKRPRSRSSTILGLINPFTNRRSEVYVERRKTVHKEAPSSSKHKPTRRTGSPPPPPKVHQRTGRSISPFQRTRRMPSPQGGSGFVPLPPKLPVGREQSAESSTRRSRDSERDVQSPIIRQRSPRPYSSHQAHTSGPFDIHEQVVEPTSPRPQERNAPSGNYEVVQPNETVRSRRRHDEVRNSREYRQLEEYANQAVERGSRADVRIQNLQAQLASMEVRENQKNQLIDDQDRRIEKLQKDLEHALIEKRLAEERAQIAQDQRELARQRNRDRDRDREHDRDRARESSGNDSSGGRHRRHRYGHDVNIIDARDAQPRTPNPRSSNITTATPTDAGSDAIAQARADAARNSGRA